MDSNYSGAVALGFNTSASSLFGHVRLEPLDTADAVWVGLIGPTNEDAPGDQAEGIKGQARTDKRDSVAASADQQAITDRKRFSTLRVRLAQGFSAFKSRIPGLIHPKRGHMAKTTTSGAAK